MLILLVLGLVRVSNVICTWADRRIREGRAYVLFDTGLHTQTAYSSGVSLVKLILHPGFNGALCTIPGVVIDLGN